MRALKFSPVFHRSQSTSVKIVGRQGIKKSKLYVIHAFPPLPDADHTLFILQCKHRYFAGKLSLLTIRCFAASTSRKCLDTTPSPPTEFYLYYLFPTQPKPSPALGAICNFFKPKMLPYPTPDPPESISKAKQKVPHICVQLGSKN